MNAYINEFIIKSKNILELGCGDGLSLSSMAKQFSDKIFTGIDINAIAIANAKYKIDSLPNLNFYCINIFENDQVLEKYDLILSHDTFVLFSFDMKKKMIEILLSHLNTGGTLIINDFNHKVLLGNALGNLTRFKMNRVFYFLWLYILYQIRRLLKRAKMPVVVYYFGDKKWYIDYLHEFINSKVSFYPNKGHFLNNRTVPYFQSVADHYVSFRDLIVIEKI